MAVNYKGGNMCIKCGCGKKKGEPGYGKGKSTKATMKSRVAPSHLTNVFNSSTDLRTVSIEVSNT